MVGVNKFEVGERVVKLEGENEKCVGTVVAVPGTGTIKVRLDGEISCYMQNADNFGPADGGCWYQGGSNEGQCFPPPFTAKTVHTHSF